MNWLHDRTILLSIVGSNAYGMETETSDVDVKGICIPPIGIQLGFLNHFEQAQGKEHIEQFHKYLLPWQKDAAEQNGFEGEIYNLSKFMALASDANPNILDLLFSEDSDIRLSSPEGHELRKNRNLFLSKRARFTFGGYAFAQLKRIKTHRKWLLNPIEEQPKRSDFGLINTREVPKDSLDAALAEIKKVVDSWEIDFGEMPEGEKIRVQEGIEKSIAERVALDKFHLAGNLLGYDTNWMEYIEKERQYKQAHHEWVQYQTWKEERNEKRAELEKKFHMDTKHASHLVRLLRMAQEILTEGKVHVRRPDAKELLDIRNGTWSYEQLIGYAEEQEKKLAEAYDKSSLPRSPDVKKLDQLCVDLNLMINTREKHIPIKVVV